MQCRTWSFPWHQGWTNPIKNYECFQHGVASGEELWCWKMSAEVPKARGGVPCASHSWLQTGCPGQGSNFRGQHSPSSGKLLAPCLFLHLGKRCCCNTLPLEMAWMEGTSAHPIRCSSISQGMLLPPPQAAPSVQGWSTHQTWLWLPL